MQKRETSRPGRALPAHGWPVGDWNRRQTRQASNASEENLDHFSSVGFVVDRGCPIRFPFPYMSYQLRLQNISRRETGELIPSPFVESISGNPSGPLGSVRINHLIYKLIYVASNLRLPAYLSTANARPQPRDSLRNLTSFPPPTYPQLGCVIRTAAPKKSASAFPTRFLRFQPARSAPF